MVMVDLPTADMKTGYSPVFDSIVVNSLVVDSATFDLQMDLMEPLKVDTLKGDLAIVDSEATLLMKPILNSLSSKVLVSCVVFR